MNRLRVDAAAAKSRKTSTGLGNHFAFRPLGRAAVQPPLVVKLASAAVIEFRSHPEFVLTPWSTDNIHLALSWCNLRIAPSLQQFLRNGSGSRDLRLHLGHFLQCITRVAVRRDRFARDTNEE